MTSTQNIITTGIALGVIIYDNQQQQRDPIAIYDEDCFNSSNGIYRRKKEEKERLKPSALSPSHLILSHPILAVCRVDILSRQRVTMHHSLFPSAVTAAAEAVVVVALVSNLNEGRASLGDRERQQQKKKKKKRNLATRD